ncbi:MAG: helix-turn-helix transcriptional regulator [Limnohabitans sp.]|jgi:HTH-type transcriptional regulator/antitoxin HipB|nr:helix-turn-helix transcriptional regulator [Limnohabitans sp.]
MSKYTIQTADQLKPIIAGFRKSAGLTQEDLAMRLGITQQTYSAAERNASNMSVSKLLTVLNALGVELVLQPKPTNEDGTPAGVKSAQW